MAENSKIEWTKNTFNPWIGCQKVAAGCTHCYAEAFAKRYGKAEWGANGTRVKTSDANWRLPLKWNREAEKAGTRDRVFCASLADVFEDWIGPVHGHKGGVLHRGDAWYADRDFIESDLRIGKSVAKLDDVRQKLFALIDATPHLDWLLLTKRPERIRECWNAVDPRPAGALQKHRKNVWLGTSIATQEDAEKNIPALLKCRDLAPVLFVSAEPLLGPVDLSVIKTARDTECDALTGIYRQWYDGGVDEPSGEQYFDGGPRVDWVIAGGESGHGARPCNVEWIRSLVAQCKAAGVPCMVKQLGAEPRPSALPSDVAIRFLKDKKGGDWNEWPEDLRVREYPAVRA